MKVGAVAWSVDRQVEGEGEGEGGRGISGLRYRRVLKAILCSW